MTGMEIVPLIIHGEDIAPASQASRFVSNDGHPLGDETLAHGATPTYCRRAVESCAMAFESWKATPPAQRRALFNRAAVILQERASEVSSIMVQELACSQRWAAINLNDGVSILEECAATVTSGVLSGNIPVVRNPEAHASVLKEPLGVVLGIAPWNAPLILGIRAVASAVAAGNTAILKGSELSPRTHYFVARLFRDAGFPPGVVNFILHRPEDAAACYEEIISHPAVRKCNFTGSTAVGRVIASRAAHHLKPVLLELGGKNYAVVLNDADLDKAAVEILQGGLLNTGQICMSTDIVLVSRTVEAQFRLKLREKFRSVTSQEATRVVSAKSEARIQALLNDAESKGASLTREGHGPLPATLVEDVTPEMDYWSAESFGPILGLRLFEDPSEAVKMVNGSDYGLSAAIFSRDQLKALAMAKKLQVGAIHINASTVHDEAPLPHGGYKNSGWGRFGGSWAFEEFLQTKTIIMNP